MRSLFGAIFPLFTTYMFEVCSSFLPSQFSFFLACPVDIILTSSQNLGIHWGSAVPGFIALACFPFPIIFYLYGAKIRSKCKYAAIAAAQTPGGPVQEGKGEGV